MPKKNTVIAYVCHGSPPARRRRCGLIRGGFPHAGWLQLPDLGSMVQGRKAQQRPFFPKLALARLQHHGTASESGCGWEKERMSFPTPFSSSRLDRRRQDRSFTSIGKGFRQKKLRKFTNCWKTVKTEMMRVQAGWCIVAHWPRVWEETLKKAVLPRSCSRSPSTSKA
jgi:hypothetical protein